MPPKQRGAKQAERELLETNGLLDGRSASSVASAKTPKFSSLS